MCEKQERIDSLTKENHELEKLLSETRKNYADAEKLTQEGKKFKAEMYYFPIKFVWIPVILSLIASVAALLKP